MDTVESRTEPQAARGTAYDGFISYSHDADDLLAPRLQAGLQRFAKPWWKRRALRIFRDESSLSANPHLWSSITDALDNSGWFVLLLSPDAAASPWVNNEIDYWLEHKDPERIIPVLTDGAFGWSDGDVTGDSVPLALLGAFSDEPRWVDLRFARTEEQLDLQNPQFSAAIADVASALHGVPKDELASEEVRQHRRTRRTAVGAGIALLALAIAAGGAALFANAQRIEADEQRAAAESERDRADTEAERANQLAEQEVAAREEADAQREVADTNARIAKARELAAAAVSVLGDNPELSTLLALQSIAETPPEAATSSAGLLALRSATQANQLTGRFTMNADGLSFGRLSPDGSTLFTLNSADGTVAAIDVETGSTIWSHRESPLPPLNASLGLSPDGKLLALTVEPDSGDAQIVVLRADDGQTETTLAAGACVPRLARNGFSADGRWLLVQSGTETCLIDNAATWISVYDTETWSETHRLSIEGEGGHRATLSAASDRVLVSADLGPAELRSFPEMELILSLGETTTSILSPDGTRAVLVGPGDGDLSGGATGIVDALRPRVIDLETGHQLFFLDAVDEFPIGDEFVFSPDGTRIVVTTHGHDYVFDATDGRLLTDLGEPGITSSAFFTAAGNILSTSNPGSILLWDIGDSGGERADQESNVGTNIGAPIELAGADAAWVNPNEVVVGPRLAVRTLAEWPNSTHPDAMNMFVVGVIDPETGAIISEVGGSAAQLPDGRFVVRLTTPQPGDVRVGPIVLWDPATGATTELTTCSALASEIDSATSVPCPDEEPLFGERRNDPGVVAATDGSFLAAESHAPAGEQRLVRVWDADSLQVLGEYDVRDSEYLYLAGPTWTVSWDRIEFHLLVRHIPSGEVIAELDDGVLAWVVAVSPNASLLYVTDFEGRAWAYDTASWEVVASWETHDGRLRGFAVSPDANRLVTTGNDEFVMVWDVSVIGAQSTAIEQVPLLDRIPAPQPSDAAWLTDDRIVVYLAAGARQLEIPLALDDVVTDAANRLTRSFTATECATYNIDPCPTLDEIRSR